METWEWIALAVAGGVFVLLLAIVWGERRSKRADLRERFGPEYDRAVSDTGRHEAEQRLAVVAEKHDELELRTLPVATRERYLEEWRHAETRFVTDPADAARAAQRVVVRALEDRGYPIDGDVEEQAAYVAADHPDIVERYRHGHAMLSSADGDQRTEDLRKAMLDFRAVLDDVLEADRSRVPAQAR